MSKLTFKIELQYFFEDKKVVFHNEICNDGLTTKSISIGNNKVIEKKINDRVLSGECLFNGITCGYTYIYDQEGTTIDFIPTNKNISIDESIDKINKIKKSKEFLKAEMDGLLTITDSPKFISIPSKNFTVYKEIELIDDKNTYTYLLKKNFTCHGKIAKVENKEEKYQINNDYVLFLFNLKNNAKTVRYKINTDETETTQQNIETQKEVQSIIEQLKSLKKLLNSSPKSYKNLKIETKKNNTKKTIR